jgi:hypothetical protein
LAIIVVAHAVDTAWMGEKKRKGGRELGGKGRRRGKGRGGEGEGEGRGEGGAGGASPT